MMMKMAPKDWWRVRPMGDGVTMIDEPHIVEFYRCNVWHVRGRDRDMLVDSGMGVVSLRDWVPLVTEKPMEAVASHTHFDHIGCHHEFPCRSCHGAEAHLMRAPTRANTFADKYVTDEIFTALPPDPYQSPTYTVKAACTYWKAA
jgi:glyoxylase-like metal-dependent hydrolase (beta-lactamase superfamily II)